MRSIIQNFSAAVNGRALTIDRDCVLKSVLCFKGSLISTDPAATIANTQTAPGDSVANDHILNFGGSNLQLNVDFSLVKSQVIYLSINAAGFIQLFFEDIPAETP